LKSADVIYQEMCTSYAELTGVTVKDGCDMAVRLYAAAAQIESLYAYNDWVKKQCFPQTATGEYLDNHAEMRGLSRIDAVCSRGIIKFTANYGVSGELTIPEGTVCVTASGERFITTESGVIAAGETYCECSAAAMEAGKSGNVEADTIVFMEQPPVGIDSCVNEAPFTGGVDAESDDSLRERIIATYNSLPNGSNAAYYEKLAMSVSGVEAVSVIPKKRGIGTVDVVISGTEGMPSDELIGQVLDIINESREICTDVQVYGPASVAVDVDVKIEVEDKFNFNTVSNSVEKAVDDYFDGKLLGCDILRAKLGSIIYGTEGMRNYSINLPASDILISADQLPVLGTVTVSQMS